MPIVILYPTNRSPRSDFEFGGCQTSYVLKKQRARPSFRWNGLVTLATSYFRTTYRGTIIGAAAFHFRVRNGNGWCHCAEITRRLGPFRISDFGFLRSHSIRQPGQHQISGDIQTSSEAFKRTRISNQKSEIINIFWFSDICIQD